MNMDKKKQTYEAPITEAWEVRMESGLLQASVESTREGYGRAVEDEWE